MASPESSGRQFLSCFAWRSWFNWNCARPWRSYRVEKCLGVLGPDMSATEMACLPRHEAEKPVSEKEDSPAFDEVIE